MIRDHTEWAGFSFRSKLFEKLKKLTRLGFLYLVGKVLSWVFLDLFVGDLRHGEKGTLRRDLLLILHRIHSVLEVGQSQSRDLPRWKYRVAKNHWIALDLRPDSHQKWRSSLLSWLEFEFWRISKGQSGPTFADWFFEALNMKANQVIRPLDWPRQLFLRSATL